MDKDMVYLIQKKKKEIFPFSTIWMNPEGIMLSEINQRKTSTVSSHLYVESLKKKLK